MSSPCWKPSCASTTRVLIYRGKRLVNWCCYHRTVISDIEVEEEEQAGHLWHIRYPYADGSGHVTVATTRPETMLGDSAVAVNPKDERYDGLVGKMIALPLSDRQIPLIADDYAQAEFGTGAVKVTPAHDPNDYEAGPAPRPAADHGDRLRRRHDPRRRGRATPAWTATRPAAWSSPTWKSWACWRKSKTTRTGSRPASAATPPLSRCSPTSGS